MFTIGLSKKRRFLILGSQYLLCSQPHLSSRKNKFEVFNSLKLLALSQNLKTQRTQRAVDQAYSAKNHQKPIFKRILSTLITSTFVLVCVKVDDYNFEENMRHLTLRKYKNICYF